MPVAHVYEVTPFAILDNSSNSQHPMSTKAPQGNKTMGYRSWTRKLHMFVAAHLTMDTSLGGLCVLGQQNYGIQVMDPKTSHVCRLT